jgi:hypothetical protein
VFYVPGIICSYLFLVCPRVVNPSAGKGSPEGDPKIRMSVCMYVCPRVITRVLVLKGGVGEPLFSECQFVRGL